MCLLSSSNTSLNQTERWEEKESCAIPAKPRLYQHVVLVEFVFKDTGDFVSATNCVCRGKTNKQTNICWGDEKKPS